LSTLTLVTLDHSSNTNNKHTHIPLTHLTTFNVKKHRGHSYTTLADMTPTTNTIHNNQSDTYARNSLIECFQHNQHLH